MYENEKLEEEIYEIIDNKYDFEEITQLHTSYEYYYYLSYLRENLFVWYPFKDNASLLEIGGGYGALTRLFCRKVDEVVSIEDSYKKADMISKRCHADNLEVVVNDFSEIEQTPKKFDYIIVSDLFEYAREFYESSNPFKDYLTYLKGFLKDDGVILLAISNRFGLKYFAGFKEEHVNEYFTGVDDFPKKSVRTFTKGELENIIESAEFSDYKFFYPYPDHVFPEVINTDKFINKISYERKPTIVKARANFFRENKVNQSLASEDIAQYFANSFLVEIRNDTSSRQSDNYDYVKINNERKQRYRTITYIYSDNNDTRVVKYPLNEFSKQHLLRMHEGSKNSFGKIKFLENTFDDYYFSYPYIEHESFEKTLIKTIINHDKDGFFELLEEYFDVLFYGSFKKDDYCTPEFLDIFGVKSDKCFRCHDITNLDVIFSNLFIINDEFVSIDYEWLFDFSVPLEYIFYRVIHHHHVSNPLFRDFITLDEIFEHFDLDTDNFDLFKEWEKHFLNYAISHMKKPKTRITAKKSVNKLDNVDAINKGYQAFKKENEILNKRVEEQEKLINTYKYSTSWKITKPLRKIGQIMKNK
ncbi:MAG: hypothetical protein BZ136_08680 [Methanosphaera sp. rholeuAM74]|nr:MAG: hypothetical protein BZ136_08680 [Methanosphaera sp. rholeuAM74]